MTNIATTDLAVQLPLIHKGLASGEEFLLTLAGQPVGCILPAQPSEVGTVLSNEEWQREFAAWMSRDESRADRYLPCFALDDSYEAIYGERESAKGFG